VHAFGFQVGHFAGVTVIDGMSGRNLLNGLFDRTDELLISRNSREVRLWVVQREHFRGDELRKGRDIGCSRLKRGSLLSVFER